MFCWDRERIIPLLIYGVLGVCELCPDEVEIRAKGLYSFAEMITGYPLFRGRDNADQLVQIMKIVGTPSDATIAQIKINSVSPTAVCKRRGCSWSIVISRRYS
jgi:hypothetical protein